MKAEKKSQSPREVGEGFVGFCHAQRVLFFLYSRALVVGCEHELGGEFLRHRLATASPRGVEYPAERERLLALGAHLARYLVVGATHAAGADFHRGADIADSGLKKLHRVLHLGLLFDYIERIA